MLANLELEATLLGALLIENSLLDAVVETVDPADFHTALHGRIFAAIAREVALGNLANPITIKGYFENDADLKSVGGIGYLAQLYNETSGLTAPRKLAEQVRDLSQRRRMQAGLADAATCCADLTTPLADIVSQADDAMTVRGKEQIHQPTGAQCMEELIASYGLNNKGVASLRIPSIDGLLGPIKPKQLVIMAGRPGMGKTAVALSYGLGAAKAGHGVLFVSLEMSSTELGARMAADLCFDEYRIPFSAIRDGTLQGRQRQDIGSVTASARSLPFQVIDTGTLTVGRLGMMVRRHQRRMEAAGHTLELVIVDYLQLLSPDTKGRSNYEAVSEVSRALKAIAKDCGVAIMALAQLSRAVESRPDKRPQLSDLRDSGQIEQDADAVLFLLRAEYYLKQAEPDEDSPHRGDWLASMDEARNVIEFILAKRRNGVTGTALGEFHGAFQAVRG